MILEINALHKKKDIKKGGFDSGLTNLGVKLKKEKKENEEKKKKEKHQV